MGSFLHGHSGGGEPHFGNRRPGAGVFDGARRTPGAPTPAPIAADLASCRPAESDPAPQGDDGLEALLSAVSEAHDRLRNAGLTTACAYLRSSAAGLRLAVQAATTVRARDVVAPSASDTFERPALLDGRHLGVCLAPRADGFADLVPSHPGGNAAYAASSRRLAWPTGADLSVDLLASDAARTFAADDIFAALLMHVLHAHAWTSPARGARWLCSPQAASLLLRVMRNGRAAAPLAATAGSSLIPIDVVRLIAGLGWHPDR